MITKGSGDNLRRNLYCFGDSLTAGSLSIPDPNHPYGYAYYIVNRTGWKMVNYAVGGTRIEDSTQTQNMGSLPATKKDRILWLTGYNDMRYYGNNSTAIDAYGVALTSWLTTLSSYGCPIILGNCLKMTASGYTQGGNDYDNGSDAAANAYSSKIATVAASFPLVTVVDVNSLYSPSTGDYQGDLVHFNFTGCNTIGNLFLSAINTAGLR